jgi:hypothetical protein
LSLLPSAGAPPGVVERSAQPVAIANTDARRKPLRRAVVMPLVFARTTPIERSQKPATCRGRPARAAGYGRPQV